MNLKSYIQTTHGNGVSLAETLGIQPAFLSQMASGHRGITALRAVEIERATNGLVKRWDMRPDDWQDIWPELVGMPGAPKPKAPANA